MAIRNDMYKQVKETVDNLNSRRMDTNIEAGKNSYQSNIRKAGLVA